MQGGDDAERAEQAGHGVGNGKPHVQGPSVRFAANIGKAAHGFEHPGESGLVAVRAGLPEPRHAQDGQRRILLMQPFARHAPAVQRAGAEVLHQRIEAGQQTRHDVAPFRGAQIDRNAFLVAIGHLPPQRHALLVRRQGPQGIARPGNFHLQHVGAQVCQQRCGPGAGHHGGQVKNTDAFQRTGTFLETHLLTPWALPERSGKPRCANTRGMGNSVLKSSHPERTFSINQLS
ncbi:hypothetical protein D9M68_680730 [compost metagenome]